MAKEQEFIEKSAAAWLARRDRDSDPRRNRINSWNGFVKMFVTRGDGRLEKTWSRLDTARTTTSESEHTTTSEELEQGHKLIAGRSNFLASSCAAAVVF